MPKTAKPPKLSYKFMLETSSELLAEATRTIRSLRRKVRYLQKKIESLEVCTQRQGCRCRQCCGSYHG